MTITHITERELALERENERLINTIRVQAAAIEAQQEEIALLNATLESRDRKIAALKSAILDDVAFLTKKVEQFEADAARYRWLKKMHDICNDEITLWHVRDGDGQPVNFGRLDAAIDAAMKETK